MNDDDIDDDKPGIIDDKKSSDRKPRIRPVSRITSGPLSKLRTARCFEEIDRRIRLGWSSSDLARAIQEEFKELTDVPVKYLRKLLDKHRSSIPDVELSMSSANSLVARNATRRIANGLDELAEIEKLYNLQMKRIAIDVANEEKIKKLFNTTGREVFVAMKLLKQSTDLKMDMGLVKRQIGSMEVTGQLAAEVSERYGKDSIGKVIADPDSRRKVLSIAERLLQIGAKAGIDAVEILRTTPDDSEPDGDVIDVESKDVHVLTENTIQDDNT